MKRVAMLNQRNNRSGHRTSPASPLAHRLIALTLIGALLSPAVALAGSAGESRLPVASQVAGDSLLSSLRGNLAAFFGLARAGQDRGMSTPARVPQLNQPRKPLTKDERKAKVKGLALNPRGEISMETGQSLIFTAVPLDAEGQAIQGLAAEWESSDNRVIFVSPEGEANAVGSGAARLTAKAGNKSASVNVVVVPVSGDKLSQKRLDSTGDRQARRTRNSGAGVGFVNASGTRARSPFSIIPARYAAGTENATTAAPLALRAPEDDPLPDAQTSSLYLPSNDVGTPRGKTEPGASTPPAASNGTETPGSANFSLSAPVVNLSGRGLGVSLALNYNSRVWHKSGAELTYDVDSGWPAPGFRLGYGQLEDQGSYGFTLTEPNGTRHELAKTGAANSLQYDSTDGTFIHFLKKGRGGTVTYTDGTRVEYGAAGNGYRSYPQKIVDPNGNFLLISYVGGVGPRISSIHDTLDRYVRFYYQGDELTSVTVPKLNGAATEETATVKFYYGTIDFTTGLSNLQNLFQTGLVTLHAPNTARVIRYVHYPGTGTGYRYDYSPYGMIRQIVQLREMQPVNFDLNPLVAASNDGQWAASTLYGYPNSGVALTDAPRYDSRTDDWVGRTSGQPIFNFEENEAAGISRVIAPDGSVSETKTVVATGTTEQWKNGLVEETSLKASQAAGAAVLARTRFEWEQGGTNLNPRLKKVWTTDETGETRAVVYALYDAYNNVRAVSEHNFAAYPSVGAELRRTETDYVTAANYVNRRLLHLPAQVRVVANGVVASRTDYGYDETPLLGRGAARITGHEQAFNPAAPQVWRCIPTPKCEPDDLGCGCGFVDQYDPATAYRGNLTSVKAYSNAANIAAGTTTTNTVGYDILGNVVEQTANCCRQKVFTYTEAYKFAYPETVTRGDAPQQLSTSAVYDFNTGLVTSTEDENEQVMSVYYDVETQLPARVERPDGGGVTEFFNEPQIRIGPDNAPRYWRNFTRTSFENGRWVESHRYFDGRGAVVRSFDAYTAGQGWATTDIQYDAMGRLLRTSNPYHGSGEMAQINVAGLWTTNSVIDKLGRVTEVTLPDGAKVTSVFSGKVATVTDQANRQRRQLRDALGRVVELHEPDASGNLGALSSPTQKTVYEFDGLDNLTKVIQAGSYGGGAQATQERVFKYDSLSQLTHQRQVEAAARLNDAGAVVASGGEWSRVAKYDTSGKVTDSYDARGVHTHIEYDALNRVREVTYSDGTPTLTYTYDEARVDAQGQPYFNRGRLTRLATAAVGNVPATVQEYDHDRVGRTVAQRQSVGSNTYALAYKYNLAGLLTEQVYPSGRVVKQFYDDAARIVSVSNGSGTQVYESGLKYAPHGGLAGETLGNGTVAEMEYNSRLQLKTHTLKRGNTLSAEVIQRYSYKYGQVDQATGAVDEAKNAGQIGKVESYIGGTAAQPVKQWEERLTYDTLGRLAQASERRGDNSQLTWQSNYSFDRFGNRYQHQAENSQALSYTPVEAADVDRATNRLTAPTANTPGVEYNYAGQVTRDTKFRFKQFEYDAHGRMTRAANLDNSGATTAVYDGLGQRVQTAYAGQPRVLVYDISGQVVAEYGVAESDGGGLRYVFSDQQGSTRAVLNGQGQVTARRDYAPFGEDVGAVGTRAGVGGYNSADETRQQYALTERDKETGLDHTWWRKYDQATGRWTSPDPYNGSMNIGDPQSFNRYAYVGNDPMNLIDPSGLNAAGPGTTYSKGMLWTLWRLNEDGRSYSFVRQWFEPYGSEEQTGSNYTPPKEVREILAKEKCKIFLDNLLKKAVAAGLISADVTLGDIASSLDNATYVRMDNTRPQVGNNQEKAVQRDNNTLTLYRGFFFEQVPLTPSSSSRGSTSIGTVGATPTEERASSPSRQASILIGEGVHLLFSVNSDVILANLLKGKDEFKDKNKASDYFHGKLEGACK